MTNNVKSYVYYLIDRRNNKPFYVGVGIHRRMYCHVCKVKSNIIPNGNNKLSNKIKKILKLNTAIKYKKVFESYDKKMCLEREIEEIFKIGLDNLCNLTPGGELGHPFPHSKKTREKISKGVRKAYREGKIITKQLLKFRSERWSGKNNPSYGGLSDKHKEKLWLTRDKTPMIGKNNWNATEYIIESPTGIKYTIFGKSNVNDFFTSINNNDDKIKRQSLYSSQRISWKGILYSTGSKGWKLISNIKINK